MTPEGLFQIEFTVCAGLFGLVVGSFLNVCIYRLPLGKSVVTPRSSCPQCGHLIRWYHNLPVFSYVFLGGQCADCRAPIPLRYPLVEALNAALWIGTALRFGPTLQALLLLPFLSAMLALFFTDLDHKLLPDRITLPIALLGIALSPWNARLDLESGIYGFNPALGRFVAATGAAVGAAGALYFIGWVGSWAFRKEALGFGDVKLMLSIGAYLGLSGAAVTIFLGSVVGSLVGLPRLLRGRFGEEIPFGCYLCPAAAAAVFYGYEIVRWYLARLFLPPLP